MNGLKPFRNIPRDLIEWTRWMREQDIPLKAFVNDLIEAASGTTSTSVLEPVGEHSHKWTIKDFTGSYVLITGDAGKLLRSMGASAANVTIPAGVMSVGRQVTIMQHGAGTVTVVADTGVTIRTPSTLVFNEQYGTVTLIQIDNDEWVIAGRMSAS